MINKFLHSIAKFEGECYLYVTGCRTCFTVAPGKISLSYKIPLEDIKMHKQSLIPNLYITYTSKTIYLQPSIYKEMVFHYLFESCKKRFIKH